MTASDSQLFCTRFKGRRRRRRAFLPLPRRLPPTTSTPKLLPVRLTAQPGKHQAQVSPTPRLLPSRNNGCRHNVWASQPELQVAQDQSLPRSLRVSGLAWEASQELHHQARAQGRARLRDPVLHLCHLVHDPLATLRHQRTNLEGSWLLPRTCIGLHKHRCCSWAMRFTHGRGRQVSVTAQIHRGHLRLEVDWLNWRIIIHFAGGLSSNPEIAGLRGVRLLVFGLVFPSEEHGEEFRVETMCLRHQA